ncbi:hypothetical protein [Thermoactinospora rubra]|uniref:hypothetical protein n=1 Tax=Thermoactinospora rubra TaxID=1088767 RepID=UPI000A0F7E11|nr:hypothetical protein [Thermoactinospora rubra]
MGNSRGPAFAVTVAGALLVVSATLPWAGIEARSDLIGAGVSHDVRGVDDAMGLSALAAGLVAAGLGLAGLLTGRRLPAALALLPGGLAVVLPVLFLTGTRGAVSVELGGLLSVEPGLRYGWFATLASAVAVVVSAIVAISRRSPGGAVASDRAASPWPR